MTSQLRSWVGITREAYMGGGCLLQSTQETSSCPKGLTIIRALHTPGHAGRANPRRFLELIGDDFLTQMAEELTS